MSGFNLGNPVYMVSADNTGGWVAGKVYRAVIVSKNGNNLNIRFEDGTEMPVTPDQLQNISLNVNPPIVGLNQATLFTAFNEQQGKTPDTYFQILRDAQQFQLLDTRNTANMLVGLKKGGRKSRRKSRRRRRSNKK
jgi:hypothetical protein